jgi:amino acid adenylation domain-containing protein/non-ribosomal peptide synthase protein (TIGR01720 family)
VENIYGFSNVNVDLELHGRDNRDFSMPLDEAVGWFTCIIPVSSKMKASSVPQRIAELADYITQAKINDTTRLMQASSNISLNYWGNWDFSFERDEDIFKLDRIEILSAKQNKMPYPLSIEAYIKQKKLHLVWTYSNNHFKRMTIKTLSAQWKKEFHTLVHQNFQTTIKRTNRFVSSRDNKKYYHLSDLQKGLFYLSKIMGKNDPYSVQVSIELQGEIKIDRIKQSLRQLVQHYPFLRACIATHINEPIFLIQPSVTLPFTYIDLSHVSCRKAEQALQKHLKLDQKHGVSIKASPLVRFKLLQFSSQKAYLVFTSHHIIFDGWCFAFLMRMFLTSCQHGLYHPVAYSNDLNVHQHYLKWLSEKKNDAGILSFWKTYLQGFSSPTLSDLLSHDSSHAHNQIKISCEIGKAAVDKIRHFIQVHKLTLSAFLHAIFALVLYRYTQAEDVLFGTTVTHRQASITGIREAVGCYFNTVPIRYRFSQQDTFLKVLTAVKDNYLNVIEKGVLDLHTIQTFTEVASQSDLFHAMFIFEQHTAPDKINLPCQNGLKIKSYSIDNPTHYPLSLTVLSLDQIKLTLTQDLVKLNTIDAQTFLQSILHTIQACIDHVHSKITQTSLLSEKHIYQQCIQWNNSTILLKPLTVIDLIDQMALQDGNKIAIQSDNQSLSYKALVDQAHAVATYLIDQGIQENEPIACYLKRDIFSVVFILGILKSGHAFASFDADTPILRVLDSLKQSGIRHLWISNTYYDRSKSQLETQDFVTVHPIHDAVNDHLQHETLLPQINSEHPAYVLFTSGSTGHPKGVYIKHISFVNLMMGMQKILSAKKNDYILALTPITFDISLLEIFLPLTIGATCVMTETIKQQGIMPLVSSLKQMSVTIMQATPPTWSLLIDAGWKGSGTLTAVCGGDKLSVTLAGKLLERCKRLWHVYGPTETTIWSTYINITKSMVKQKSIPIGVPIQNNYVFILDKFGHLLPTGCKGELYIGGCSVAKGYHDPTLTQKAFHRLTISPEIKRLKETYTQELHYLDTLYKTGDIAAWSKNGKLYFIGRSDSQVKIRGFRVDLSEIESAILKNSHIKQVVVLLHAICEQDKRLSAYYVSDHPIEIEVLKQAMAKYLPDYMLPSSFVRLNKLPTTKHGKIDKQKLLTYRVHTPSGKAEKITLTTFQNEIKSIWESILHRPFIDREDNFFNCGGHSLIVLKLLSMIKSKIGIDVPLETIVHHPRLIDFCHALEKGMHAAPSTARRAVVHFHHKKIPYPVVKLADGSSEKTLFLFHPIGGTIFWYLQFAAELKKLDSFSIYAFQDPGILDKKIIFNHFNEMAEFYVSLVTQIQSQGKYYLAGASSGANMAVEAARLLTDQGRETAFVGLLDGWAKYPRHLLDTDVFHKIMVDQYNAFQEKFKRFDINDAAQIFNIQRQRQKLLFQHPLASIPFNIHLYKSVELVPVFKKIDEPSNYWQEYCKGQCFVRSVPGNHESMFADKNAPILAKTVYQDLKE